MGFSTSPCGGHGADGVQTGSTTREPASGPRGGRAWWLAAAAVLLLGFGLRVAYYWEGYSHPDESITTEVVGHMRRSGDWDTNWAKAANLPTEFRDDQYNFSSHLYATYFFYRFVKWVPGTEEFRGREGGFWVYRLFSVLMATGALGLTLALARRAGGNGVALLAGRLTAVSVQLVQDAHYSRPDAFVTALTVAAVALCWPARRLRFAAVAGGAFLLGLLVACKVSLLLLAWLPGVPLLAAAESVRRRVAGGATALPAMLAGFACGVPGALTRPDVFLHGVSQLMKKYSGAHPPHSHLDGGMVADFMGGYYAETIGWAGLLGGVLGIVTLARQRRWATLVLLAGPVASFAGYFATREVFFERNVSHVLPLFFILVALGTMEAVAWASRYAEGRWGRLGRLAGLGLGLLLLTPPAIRYTWPLVSVEYSGIGARRLAAFEAELRDRHPEAEWREVGLLNDGPPLAVAKDLGAGGQSLLLRVTDYGDEWTAFNLSLLETRFAAKLVADYPSTFPDLPVCTLHTYNSSRSRYYLVTGLRGR